MTSRSFRDPDRGAVEPLGSDGLGCTVYPRDMILGQHCSRVSRYREGAAARLEVAILFYIQLIGGISITVELVTSEFQSVHAH